MKICVREGCGKEVIDISNFHKKKYCSYACAIQVSREKAEIKRRAKQKL